MDFRNELAAPHSARNIGEQHHVADVDDPAQEDYIPGQENWGTTYEYEQYVAAGLLLALAD